MHAPWIIPSWSIFVTQKLAKNCEDSQFSIVLILKPLLVVLSWLYMLPWLQEMMVHKKLQCSRLIISLPFLALRMILFHRTICSVLFLFDQVGPRSPGRAWPVTISKRQQSCNTHITIHLKVKWVFWNISGLMNYWIKAVLICDAIKCHMELNTESS